MHRSFAIALAGMITILFADTTHAVVITGVQAQATSELGAPFSRLAQNTVDGSGLNAGTGTHTIVPDGNMWLNTGTFQAPNDPDPEIFFDLGGQFEIDSVRIWNYNEGVPNLTSRGVRDVTVLATDSLSNPFVPVANITVSQAPGVDNVDFSETFALNTTARFVQFDIVNGHGGDNNFLGLSEVQFDGMAVNAPISGVSIADVSSEIQAGFNRDADFLVDGSGVGFGDTHAQFPPDGTMWLNSGTGFGGGPVDTQPFVTFDLGESVNLGEVQIWNYNEGTPNLTTRGVDQLEILVGDSAGGPFTSVGIFNLNQAPGDDSVDFSQIFDLSGAGSAQFVRFDIISNHNGSNFRTGSLNNIDFNFVGLSEVRFFENNAVPEPTTAMLALLGSSLLLRRRRQAA